MKLSVRIDRKPSAPHVFPTRRSSDLTAMAFADFSPSGGTGGTGGTTGEDQGYDQGYEQGYYAGQISSGDSNSAPNLLFNRGGALNVSHHSQDNVRAHNSNKAGNANGGPGGNAFSRL